MAKGRVQSITYIWDRIIIGFLHTSFNVFFITVLVAGGVGVQDEGAGTPARRCPRHLLLAAVLFQSRA
jgi:hypothetical protein